VQQTARSLLPRVVCAAILVAFWAQAISPATAQIPASEPGVRSRETSLDPTPAPSPAEADLSPAPAKVDVKPVSRDEDIRNRLQSVLDATEWFVEPRVRVEDGVVFLNGRAETDELKKWAGDLARNTQDVAAVANRMEVPRPSTWDLRPAWRGLLTLWGDVIHSIPFLLLALLILAMSAGAGVLVTRGARRLLRKRIQARILRNVVAVALGALVFLIGTYIVLRVSGLTQLALTVVGGTGLIGLALGIAFRDITENFLASIFLSMQRPFESGDLIEVSGITGYVQQLNMRTTVVMTFEGILVQIPNAGVYKSNIRNFSTNCNRREDFEVGIGYEDAINDAQEVALKVLVDHPAVLNDPEPLVLADSLGKATVNLRVYFWVNSSQNSWLKVRSSVIRLVKLAFQKNGISMPDEAREVVFPRGIPVTMIKTEMNEPRGKSEERYQSASTNEPGAASTKAEGGLSSEAGVIEKQARQSQPIDNGENLLSGSRSAGERGMS